MKTLLIYKIVGKKRHGDLWLRSGYKIAKVNGYKPNMLGMYYLFCDLCQDLFITIEYLIFNQKNLIRFWELQYHKFVDKDERWNKYKSLFRRHFFLTILVPHHLEAWHRHRGVCSEDHGEGWACSAVGWRRGVSTECTNQKTLLVRPIIELGQ